MAIENHHQNPTASPLYDLVVIGGGINGAGIARDAQGRGLSTCLLEQSDLASGTSQASTKLIHGGLRYLEHYEFRLVRESLKERERLWRLAPHIIWPLRFTLPHHPGLRPAWLLRLGLFLYDHIGGRKKLPPTKVVDFATEAAGQPLNDNLSKGFEYSDCWVDDARLVILNALDAQKRGAVIRPRTRATKAVVENGHWQVSVETPSGPEVVHARALVNAGGPWVSEIMSGVIGNSKAKPVRLVKGSHIIVPKLFDHSGCYICQNADGRIVFAIPYEDDFTLVGTTDQDYQGDPTNAGISDEEVRYLCKLAGDYFKSPPTPEDVVHSFSGVRPLHDDGNTAAQSATRDYKLVLDKSPGAPLLTIYGGKLTTYRRLAESAMGKLSTVFNGMPGSWTGEEYLPGGDFAIDDRSDLADRMTAQVVGLEAATAKRWVRLYGTLAFDIIGEASKPEDLGQHFGHGLFEAEVRYLINHEWVFDADDILWRRTKLGFRFSAAEKQVLAAYCAA